MAYQKTAKDKAWDRERQKLQSQIQAYKHMAEDNFNTYQAYQKKCVELREENDALRAAITELTKGEMTPEEVLDKMRKSAGLSDMLKFMAKSVPGGYF